MSQRSLMPINRYNSQILNKAAHLGNNPSCIFISYQSNDRESAKKIADFFLEMGVDIYFDQYDGDLRLSSQASNPSVLVNALCKGINNSSHMVVIVSSTTMQSCWVPFEIGFGYEKTKVIALCLKGIPKGGLPEYLSTVKIIRDLWDLGLAIAGFKRDEVQFQKAENIDLGYSSNLHPLRGVMDSIISER